ncbi:MAG: hypothetical protein OXI66_02070 [Boseongicola sp.]|nr:hypothetical protein [Boseongicola sp.]
MRNSVLLVDAPGASLPCAPPGLKRKAGVPDNSGAVIWRSTCAGFLHVIEDALPFDTGAESRLP